MKRLHLLTLAVLGVWIAPIASSGCGSAHRAPEESVSRNAATQRPAASASAVASSDSAAPIGSRPSGAQVVASDRFNAHLGRYKDFTYGQLETELGLTRQTDRALTFDPTTARYYGAIVDKLQMTPEEVALFRKGGVVNVDHVQRYSMASAYYAIYTRDLPVLITTDSVLHALHRSYDNILKQLESGVFSEVIRDTLAGAHAELQRVAPNVTDKKLAASLGDVDVYVTVARNLLEGNDGKNSGTVVAPAAAANEATVRDLLKRVYSLEVQPPGSGMKLYGGFRAVDFSQFRPRGHYTETEPLQRYFRAVMWLGRADTGFVLAPPDPKAGLDIDGDRELTDAALLTMMVKKSGSDGVRRHERILRSRAGAVEDGGS